MIKNLLLLPALLTLSACATMQQSKPVADPIVQHANKTEQAYLAGEGMSYAKLADENGYPGPKHVLDLKKELQLDPEQIKQSQNIYDEMQKYARELGEKFVAKQQALKHLFVSAEINEDKLALLLTQMGIIEAKLRYVHMRAHLQQQSILSPAQVEKYQQLRQTQPHQHVH